MIQPPRMRGVGFLAAFSVLCLALVTAAEVALLLRLNSDWLDRRAWWRGPIVEHDRAATHSPEKLAEFAAAAEAVRRPAPPREEPGRLVVLTEAEDTLAYDPTREARLSNPSGVELRLPAGATDIGTIRLAPIAALPGNMAVPLAGPVYEARAGAAEHSRFLRPVTLTLPCLPGIKAGEAALAVWEDDHWEPLPSTVDEDRHLITAELPHFSLIAAVRTTTIAGTVRVAPTAAAATCTLHGLMATDATFQADARSVWWVVRGRQRYESRNVVVHYRKAEVPPDAEYPLENGRERGDHPLFVQDVAARLEEALSRLGELGIKIPAGRHGRYDAFLIDIDDYGATGPAGTVVLPARLPALATRDGLNSDAVLRAVTARGLARLACANSRWAEAVAAYLGDRCWANDPRLVESFDLSRSSQLADRLPAVSLDAAEGAAFAGFLKWLDRRYPDGVGGGVQLVSRLLTPGGDLPAAVEKALPGHTLSDLLTEFAQDYYHADAWRGDIASKASRRRPGRDQIEAQTAAPGSAFAWLVRDGVRTDAATTPVPALPHLSAQAFYVDVDRPFAAARRGKLVVAADPLPVGVRLYSAAGVKGSISVPFAGSAGAFVALAAGQATQVVADFGVAGGPDRLTIVAVNRDPAKDSTPFTLKRWWLLAPEWLTADRLLVGDEAAANAWRLTWKRAELKDFPEFFGGYTVYRRKAGDAKSELTLVKAGHMDETLTDTAPDTADYEYVVRVADRFGHESADSPGESTDPFQGVWEGEVRLVEGSLVELLSELGPEIAGRTAKSPLERKKAGERIGQFLAPLRQYDQLARLGVPCRVRIERGNGRYSLSFPDVALRPTGMTSDDAVNLQRTSAHALRAVDWPDRFPAPEVRLRRMSADGHNTIRGEYALEWDDHGVKHRCRIAWTLRRGQSIP